MNKFEKMKESGWLMFAFSLVGTIVLGMLGGVGVNMAAAVTADEGGGTKRAVGDLSGGGKTVDGGASLTKSEQVADAEFFTKQVDQKICEMKFTGTPIDQILRHGTSNKTNSITVKYYAIGQRQLKSKLTEAVAAGSNGVPVKIKVADPTMFGEMDTILIRKADGTFIMGYQSDGSTADTIHPLMLRVSSKAEDTYPMVYALNGKRGTSGKNFCLPAVAVGSTLIRLGRAAGEKDVKTGAYYNLPEPEEQYCQRFIMQVEETIYHRLSAKEVPWNFTSMERMAVDDMRIGMESSGLFGVKTKTSLTDQGNVYTQEGIYYRAGKDIELGTWVTNSTTNEKELQITEDELVDFVNTLIDEAGNGSRTKMFFVDNVLYAALAKIKTNKMRVLQTESNFQNLGLDFESFTSMGTKLLVYRHDLFNAQGFEGKGFVLDPEYLDKWVFQPWQREEFNLRELMISNGNAVTMEEFSCWTLQFPNAHARVSAPKKV